jgi:hypothetical protein
MKMKNLYPKTIILTLIACLTAVVSNAQLRNPVNILLNFYGKVVDQEGKPVVGAKVNLEAQANYFDENRSEQKPFTFQTDKNGDFNLIGAYGAIVTVSSIEKDGFELSKKVDRHYSYTLPADFHPDPQNPVIFKMWKQRGKEPLVGSAWHGKVACDGTPVDFDLYHGWRNTEGSLQITCTRTPLNFEMTSRQPFDYKVEIAVSGGGIQPTGDEFTYLAPEGGYSPSVTIERKAGDPKWGGGLRQEFYIKTAKGEYGRLSVEWDSGHRPSPTPFKWDCSINPSGSRNLER